MKRRIIKLGTSKVVSLPKSWADRYGLLPGNELEVQERGKQLTITSEKDVELDRVVLDVTNLAPLHFFCLVELYIRGVDEIEVKSKKPELIERIPEHPIPQLIGFEVIEQSKNKVLIKDVSGIKEFELQTLLRRLFLLVLSSSEEILKSVKKGDFNLTHIKSIDLNINKFAFLCLRILNKRGADDYRHTPVLFYLVTQLEAIGDEYKKLAEHLMDKKIKLSNNSIKLLEKSNQMLRNYYSIFFKFDVKTAAKIEGNYRRLMPEFENAMTKAKPMQLRALVYAEKVADRVADMLRSQLTISI